MPRQIQSVTIQVYNPIFQNGDFAGDLSYDTVLETIIQRTSNSSIVTPTITECDSKVESKYQEVLAIHKKALDDAYTAYLNSITNALIDFFLDLLGRGLYEAVKKFIYDLWYKSHTNIVSIPPVQGIGGNNFPKWPNGILVDGKWYPNITDHKQGWGPGAPHSPGAVPKKYWDPMAPNGKGGLGRWVYRYEHPNWKPPNLQPYKPPVPPSNPTPEGLRGWLVQNWGKIFGRIAGSDLYAALMAILQGGLEALKKILPPAAIAALLAALAALTYILLQLRDIYNAEVDRIKNKIRELDEWKEKALACCAKAKACGSRGEGCHQSVAEEPQHGCP